MAVNIGGAYINAILRRWILEELERYRIEEELIKEWKKEDESKDRA